MALPASGRWLLSIAISALLLFSLQSAEALNRKILQDSRVSIYDGVLPSPELGPQNSFSPESAPQPIPSIAETKLAIPAPASVKSKSVCGKGCIAGSVVGSVLGAALLASLFIYCCCSHRSQGAKDDAMSLSDMELLDHKKPPAKSMISRLPCFCVGDTVFCQKGKNCSYGTVTDCKTDEVYGIKLFDGNEESLPATKMAPNFPEGTQVLYTPPDGRPPFTGTITQADGSYWPPFYQLTPHEGKGKVINTTASCLTEIKGKHHSTVEVLQARG